jgi:crossover junction endodeoxyribonuclease RusA
VGSKRFEGRLSVTVDIYPPDRRKRDLDNVLKALFDGITHAGVWEDDSQIDELHVYRRDRVEHGLCIVEVEQA